MKVLKTHDTRLIIISYALDQLIYNLVFVQI